MAQEQSAVTRLEQLRAAATKAYSLKDYNTAAERFAEACEVQDDVNGEMVVENADLLYQYGRCLYHVAVANSDVLGGKVATSEEPKRKKRKVSKSEDGRGSSSSLIGDAIASGEQILAEDMLEAVVESKDGVVAESTREGTKETTKPGNSSNPFFQISGDDNFTDSEDDGEDAGGEDGEEEEDDFENAFGILDMARILLGKKLDFLGESKDKASEVRQVKERLADTRDLQAEIALENERFADALDDTRAALDLKVQLYPVEHNYIAEAHYKLSLALEYAAKTATQEDSNGGNQVAQVDEAMRADAAKEMELAISSSRARVAKEQARLTAASGTGSAGALDQAKVAEMTENIAEVKEMIADMESRLEDLRKPAESLSAMQDFGPAGAPGSAEIMRGVLGSLIGESKREQERRIQEATAKANDLSGMVKKKKPQAVTTSQHESSAVEEGKGKRKAEQGTEASVSNGTGKKVKFAEDANGEDA